MKPIPSIQTPRASDSAAGLASGRIRQGARRRAFTLLELLVVIALIVILLSIVLAVSARVFANQKASSTRNVLTTLDRMLDEYITVNGTIPRYRPDAWEGRPSEFVGLPSDPLGNVGTGPEDYEDNDHVRRPEVGVFLEQIAGYGAVDDLLQGIPPQFLRTYTLPAAGLGGQNTGDRIKTTVVDAWATDDEWRVGTGDTARYPMAGVGAQPLIYFVHPDNALAQDLYGRCVGGRPYFLSPGPDGRYGLGGGTEIEAGADAEQVHAGLTDNITSYAVGPANLSTGFFSSTRNQTR
jgi:prepilin-type N-terminal cleavage/methylation domain-containing protein